MSTVTAAFRMTGMSFDTFSTINGQRAARWHGTAKPWDANRWGVAAGGEMGEVLDAIKKRNRILDGFNSNNPNQPKTLEEARDAILLEIGGTATYLDLLAQYFGSSLGECLRLEFNRVSEREGMEERI